MEQINLWLVVMLAFAAGWGWGQWQSERTVRHEKQSLEKGRMVVSMPMKPEEAAATMGLLKSFIEQVEESNTESR